jgi:hypothetical protein
VGHCGSSNDWEACWEGQEVLGPVEVDALDGEPVRDGTNGREVRALEHALARVAWQRVRPVRPVRARASEAWS